jgi:hypothetical protein
MVRMILPLLVVALLAAAPPARPEKPVMVGGIADLDACLSNGQVTGLNPRGDNFLSVRSRPATNARELGRLRSGQIVWACDETADGSWTGIIFAPPGSGIDCGVGTPWPRHAPYRGPCASGWVSSRWLKIIAG